MALKIKWPNIAVHVQYNVCGRNNSTFLGHINVLDSEVLAVASSGITG